MYHVICLILRWCNICNQKYVPNLEEGPGHWWLSHPVETGDISQKYLHALNLSVWSQKSKGTMEIYRRYTLGVAPSR